MLWGIKQKYWELTSVSGPLSAPGQEKVTNSWHRLWTTKQHTDRREGKREDSFTAAIYDTTLWPWSCIQPANLPLKRKKIQTHKVKYLYSVWCFMQVIGETPKIKAVKQRTCMYIIINQPPSDFDKPLLYRHTSKCRQTDTRACALPHSRPHKKCHYVILCVLQPSAFYSLLG